MHACVHVGVLACVHVLACETKAGGWAGSACMWDVHVHSFVFSYWHLLWILLTFHPACQTCVCFHMYCVCVKESSWVRKWILCFKKVFSTAYAFSHKNLTVLLWVLYLLLMIFIELDADVTATYFSSAVLKWSIADFTLEKQPKKNPSSKA